MGRTARGTFTNAGGLAPSYSLGPITVAAGEALCVALIYEPTDDGSGGWIGVDGVALNGVSLVLEGSPAWTPGTMSTLEIFTLNNCAAGTHTLDLDCTSASGLNGIQNIAAIVTTIPDALSTSRDKNHFGAGNNASPTSGNTPTTTAANEELLGFIAQDGAVDGTWSNSFTNGQSVTNGRGYTISEGYKSVTAKGAYAAAKTGGATRFWGAGIVTVKVSALTPTSATIGMSATATLPQPGRATARTLTTMPATGALEQAGSADAKALASLDAAATMPGVWPAARMVFPPAAIAQPMVTLTAAQMSQAGSIGVRTNGDPYLAAWMDSPTTTWEIASGGEWALRIVAAIYAAPAMREGPFDQHYLCSFHEIGGVERVAIGVTPDLRLCAYTQHMGPIYSAPGVIPADGSFHQYELSVVSGRTISMDGVAVATDMIRPPSGFDGLYSEGRLPCRLMAFNGAAGATRCAAALMRIEISTENNAFYWKFTEGIGSAVSGGEDGDPDQPGVDWTLRFGWYDPRPTFPLLYGAPPTSNPASAFRWLLQTQYRKANVVRPSYRPTIGGASGYHPSEGAQNT